MTKQDLKAFEDSLYKEAENNRVPIDFLFELTGRCNFDCKMCYVHTMDNASALREELTIEQWKHIFDEAYDAGMLFATLSGGECLLRPDFRELYLYLYKKGIKVSVNTNGLLLSEDYIDFFKKYPPVRFQISLYGVNDLQYEAVTGMRVFSVVERNLKMMKDSGINLKVAITPSVQSMSFIPEIIDYVKSNKYSFLLSELILSTRDGSESEGAGLTPEDICSCLEYIARKKGKQLTPRRLEDLPLPGTGGENINEKFHCTAGLNRAHIDWKGSMHPCVALHQISCNVLSCGLPAAWQYICKARDQLTYPEKCADCAYKNVCKHCFASRNIGVEHPECNELTCQIARLKVAKGLAKLRSLSDV